MHTLDYEIDCTTCGCPDTEVERGTQNRRLVCRRRGPLQRMRPDFLFSRRRKRRGRGGEREKGRRASPTSPSGAHIVDRPIVPVQRTVLPVRYHKCRGCGTTFKSVEKR